MTEHPRARNAPQPKVDEDADRDPERLIPADQTAPGMGEVEIGGESLDP